MNTFWQLKKLCLFCGQINYRAFKYIPQHLKVGDEFKLECLNKNRIEEILESGKQNGADKVSLIYKKLITATLTTLYIENGWT